MSSQLNLQSVSDIPVPSGSIHINTTWTILNPIDYRVLYNLGAGFTSINVPTGATVAIIIPPAGNTVTITLKGITGDTGILLNPATPTVISVTTSSSFGLLIGTGTITGLEVVCL